MILSSKIKSYGNAWILLLSLFYCWKNSSPQDDSERGINVFNTKIQIIIRFGAAKSGKYF